MAATGPGALLPLVLNSVVRADMIAIANNQLGMFTRYYKVTAIGGGTQGDMATNLDTFWAPLMKALMGAAATYRGVVLRTIWPAPPLPPAQEIASSGVGTAVGDLLPRQNAGLITLRTAKAGRAYRGRVYVPFPAEGDNDANGIPQAAYMTRLDSLGADLIVNVNFTIGGRTATAQPVIWHRANLTSDVITSSLSRQKWATQRRRGSYGRINVDPTL